MYQSAVERIKKNTTEVKNLLFIMLYLYEPLTTEDDRCTVDDVPSVDL